MTEKFLCPECVAGKHRNCDGRAYDPATDEFVKCSGMAPELDDDGQPMEAGEKFKSEPERARYWLDVNHAPGADTSGSWVRPQPDFRRMDEDQAQRFLEGLR